MAVSTAAPAVADAAPNPVRRFAEKAFSGSGGAFAGLIVLIVALALTAPNFLTARNFTNIIDQITVLGILALGATFVIIIGGIDLSVGSVLALSVMVLGWLSHQGGFPLPIAMAAAIAVGALAGLINGLGVTIFRLPPFIATLAMMSIARGLANLITDGQQIVGYPEWFYKLSTARYFGFISVTVATLVILFVAGWAFSRYRRNGRALYAIGGGHEVARLAGIKVRATTTAVYVVAGVMAGIGAIVLASRLDASAPSAATGYELDVIAAVVIGGASLMGGAGRVTGTVIGVLIIGVLRNGLNLLGVSPFIQQIVIGVVIAVAVGADVLRRRRS
ncbi:ABC transporter permease [Rhodococcus sp. NCIMB 12038]|jgi:ribose transport system permease protein|uniref:ABC transporter permease n=1 Tax=Rhodococcus sp. NCIMB 12038 TaxID=933800 RepID=UPI000B3CE445|nr:ABC transporter permease [Rhodococcus sp. NCIMB 12038]OUS88547.1 sugar ABC transporter permease [Rhodococcus sp. NCIMB 12038]